MFTAKAIALGLLIASTSVTMGKPTYDFINDAFLGPLYFPQYQSQPNGW